MFDFERVSVRALVKVFGATRALAGVDLELEAGTLTAIEGPNGAGKSTLLGILATMARPTRGEVRYGDVTLSADDRSTAVKRAQVRARIGLIAHDAMLYPDLTGRENLLLFARMHGLEDARTRIGELLDRFDATAFADRAVGTYSRGQAQRVALARTVLARPRLLLLDEPSTGLDRASTERLEQVMKDEKARGAIVLLVTHDAALAERTADKRTLLERGRLAAQPPRASYRGDSEGAAGVSP